MMSAPGYQTQPARFLGFLATSMRPLQAIALTLTLLFGLAMSGAEAAPKSGAHVFLFRGLLNIFSLGMDELAAELRKQGIEASVYNHLSAPTVADKLAQKYKKGRLGKVILVGHSAGANAVTGAINRLGELGVPVTLAIGLDPVHHRTVTGQAGRYVNYYNGSGGGVPVTKGKTFQGTLDNVNRVDTDHFGFDLDKALQAEIIAMIRAAL